MLLQNVDTASVLLYALFIMSSMLHTDSVIVVNQTLSLIGTLRLPNECQVLIASCKSNKLTFKFCFSRLSKTAEIQALRWIIFRIR